MSKEPWKSALSSSGARVKSYVSQRDFRSIPQLQRGVNSDGTRQSWKQWAGQKMAAVRGAAVPTTERLALFPGYATRRYRAGDKEAFDVELFVSGFATSHRPPELASRSQRAFIRLAKGFAALPKLESDAATDALLSSVKLPPRPTEMTEELEAEALERQLQQLKSDDEEQLELVNDEPDIIPSPIGGTNLPPGELRRWHQNLETRIQPFWSSVLASRVVRFNLFASQRKEERDVQESRPVASREVATGVDGFFQAPVPPETKTLHIALTHCPIRVISDVDDTVKVAGVLAGARAVFRNVFVKDLLDIVIPGMGEWYTGMWRRGVRFHYVSNGPFELLPVLLDFFKISDLPPGSMKLRSYAGRSLFSGLLSAPAARKRAGDLELYTDLARERPEQVLAIFIRDVESERDAIDDPTGMRASLFIETTGGRLPPLQTSTTGPVYSLPPSPQKEFFTASPSPLSAQPTATLGMTPRPAAQSRPTTPGAAQTSFMPGQLSRSNTYNSMASSSSSASAAQRVAERRRYELQLRIWRARTQLPASVVLRLFREPGECVEAERILKEEKMRQAQESHVHATLFSRTALVFDWPISTRSLLFVRPLYIQSPRPLLVTPSTADKLGLADPPHSRPQWTPFNAPCSPLSAGSVHLGVAVNPQAQPPPTSPGYTLYTNGAIMQHPHMAPIQHHHHQNSLGHFPSPPNMQQQSPAAQPITSHWSEQLMKYEGVRGARSPHHRARANAIAARGATKSAITITNPNKPPEEEPPPSPSLALAHALNHPSSTVAPSTENENRPTASKPPASTWGQLDMGGIGLKTIPPTSGLFTFTFLTCLFLNHNNLSAIPPQIAKLRHLELLDLSGNGLSSVPPEIGMVTSLKELFLFDNVLTTIPWEFGTLHRLRTLGIEGNPMDAQLKAMLQKDGTQVLISYLRDSAPMPQPPPPRPIVEINPAEPDAETFKVMSFNILCERAATTKMYGYTPSWALAWEYRRGRIMEEVTSSKADIICMQEVDIGQYEDFFSKQLYEMGYDGVYGAKSRYRTMTEMDRRGVDGSAIFYKKDRYRLVENHLIEFNAIAMQRHDFKKTDAMFNRVLGRDHIAIVCLLEDIGTGTRTIVSNTHLHWDANYSDVKLVQTALLLEEVEKIASAFAKYPPPPPSTLSAHDDDSPSRPNPPTYSDGAKIPIVVCGDYNSMPSSGVYEFLSTGSLAGNHPDFLSHMYGNYTSEGLRHKLGLKSAYTLMGANGAPEEIMPMTNLTPGFREVIDYIWYSTANLVLNSVVGEIDRTYLEKVVGFPNTHFPSDHIALTATFSIKPPREPSAPRPPPVFS
uniref:CCR4-Not complex 3'-5'-exoribonuclease subunit Ccr4 n=1 Tax=Mycena chlorophos TaxID=658473 RepID=A0ABQ0M8V6_MYCCL|nr:predicted protein [Mycena chlorophos]